MKTLLKVSVLTIGCCSILTFSPSFGSGKIQEQTVVPESYSVGSYENPVVLDLRKIKNSDMLELAQKEYIRKHYEGYQIIGKMFTMHGERFIQSISLIKDDETIDPDDIKLVYFDMTEAYKKLKISHKASRGIVKQLEDKHKQLTKEELLEKERKRDLNKEKRPKK